MSKLLDKLFKNMRGMMAIAFVVLGFAYLFAVAFLKYPSENSGSVNIVTGVVSGILGVIATYFFGNSKDKSDQDKANNLNMQAGATIDTKTTIEASKPPEKTT